MDALNTMNPTDTLDTLNTYFEYSLGHEVVPSFAFIIYRCFGIVSLSLPVGFV